MARRPRQPSAEERALWSEVVRNDSPLKKRAAKRVELPKPPKPKVEARPDPPIAPFTVGSRSQTAIPGNDLSPRLSDRFAGDQLRMDRKTHRRLMAGKVRPEARIDLHGMTTAHAHTALTSFILSARSRGLRTVLVITGKGRRDASDDPVPRPHGVLRHEVPRWLSLAPLSSAVLQIIPAHRRHGGEGAYYVHLARAR